MSITSSNAILFLGVTNLYPTPQQIQGFGADDVYDTEALEISEASMGVDGILTAGYVNRPVVQAFTLQADSSSNTFFDNWLAAQRQLKDVYSAFGTIYLQGTGKKYAMNKGFLTNVMVLPNAKKLLEPRKFTVTWETLLPAPV